MHQVELDVAPAARELKPALPLPERQVPPPLHDRLVGGRERASHVEHERHQPVER
jgi:hypothetical protein